METKALNFGRLINTKQDTPEMLKKLERAVQHVLNRHEGQGSNYKCCEERAESGSLREYPLLPGNALLYDFILERSEVVPEDKDPNSRTILTVVILKIA